MQLINLLSINRYYLSLELRKVKLWPTLSVDVKFVGRGCIKIRWR